MPRRRYELTEREWFIIEPLLPNEPRGMPREMTGGAEWHSLAVSFRCALGRDPGTLWHGATGKRGDLEIMAWDVATAALRPNFMLLSTLTDVLSPCG
jgi:transposase